MLDFVLRMLAAGTVGLIMGLFTTTTRSARMFALVAMGSALIALTSIEFYKIAVGPWYSDPGRLSAQIVSALGFIGTGLIWITDGQVRGLSVAASLWLAAITGRLIGTGLQSATAWAVLMVVLIYWSVDIVIKWKKLDKR